MKACIFHLCINGLLVGQSTLASLDPAEIERKVDRFGIQSVERAQQTKERWMADPRRALEEIRRSDDLMIPQGGWPLIEEMRPIFAPHAVDLAREESAFIPLYRYAFFSCDGTNRDVLEQVVRKAIRAAPREREVVDDMVLRLISMYEPVVTSEDESFFQSLADDRSRAQSVREAAERVLAGLRAETLASVSPHSTRNERLDESIDTQLSEPRNSNLRNWSMFVVAVLLVGFSGSIWARSKSLQ